MVYSNPAPVTWSEEQGLAHSRTGGRQPSSRARKWLCRKDNLGARASGKSSFRPLAPLRLASVRTCNPYPQNSHPSTSACMMEIQIIGGARRNPAHRGYGWGYGGLHPPLETHPRASKARGVAIPQGPPGWVWVAWSQRPPWRTGATWDYFPIPGMLVRAILRLAACGRRRFPSTSAVLARG